MHVKLFLDKSVEKNAEAYFEKAKKAKKKLEGAEEALKGSLKKLEELEKKKEVEEKEEEENERLRNIKKEWYEKFRWFYSSEGFLCIGGRDATTNEIVIKKHTEKEDIVFHTDMAGSPFFVIKTEGKEVTDKTLNEAAEATASFSRAWKSGLTTLDVFYVNPDQVSKEAQSGEYMSKGSFMVRGKTNYLHPKIGLAVGVKDGKIISGPVSAIKKNADKFLIIEQGNEKTSETAKKIMKKLDAKVHIDDVIRILPSGGCKIKKS